MKIILLGLLVCISLPSCDRGSSAPKGDGSGESAADGGMDEEKLAKAIVDELEKRWRENQEGLNNKAKAITNAKQSYLAMRAFHSQYGEFPSDVTRNLLEDEGEEVPIGDSANDYLAQLLISKFLDSEKSFYTKGVKGAREGDDVFNTRDRILEKGENGFAYIKNKSQTSAPSRLPLLLAPMTGKGLKFDPKPFGGEAVVLHIDGSVKCYPIDGNGDIVMPDGRGFWARWVTGGFNEDDLVFPK